MRRIVWVASLAAALALVLSMSVAYGGISDIFGSDHDLGSPGNPTCMQCHTPHGAQGDYLWARDFSSQYPDLTGLMRLCFSCHDGSITSIGAWIPVYANHPVDPGAEGEDCDRCHDPHEGDAWKFTRTIPGVQWRNANLCNGCHADDIGPVYHSYDVLATSPNLPEDRTWDPYAYPERDFSGTRLFNEAGTQVVQSGDAYIKCATCHVPHGGSGEGMNSMAYSDPGSSHSPICENCHD